jgi:hypothetical protein
LWWLLVLRLDKNDPELVIYNELGKKIPSVLRKKYVKTVSWNAISKDAFAKTTPDNPPIVNINTNPNANSIEGVRCNDPP